MNYNKLSFARNVARNVGIIKLLKTGQRKKYKEREAYYQLHKPIETTFEVGAKKFKMHVADEQEWMRTQSFYDDKKILEELAKDVKDGDCFWDVGTNIGLYSLYMSCKVGQNGLVESFEPERRSREKLLQNIRLNNTGNISVTPFALSDHAGMIKMALSENPSAGDHKILKEHESTDREVETIEMFTGDELHAARKLRTPSVIKIDVEGHEEAVIDGCRTVLSQKECWKVVCEVHFSILASRDDDGAAERIVEKLKALAFSNIRWLDSSHVIATK